MREGLATCARGRMSSGILRFERKVVYVCVCVYCVFGRRTRLEPGSAKFRERESFMFS